MYSVFDNGYPNAPTDWIADGKLANLISSRNWAARTDVRAASRWSRT